MKNKTLANYDRMAAGDFRIGDRVLLNAPYSGDYMQEDGYSVGEISEVITPGRHYSIALDGYRATRFVDFSISEFMSLNVVSIMPGGAFIEHHRRLRLSFDRYIPSNTSRRAA